MRGTRARTGGPWSTQGAGQATAPCQWSATPPATQPLDPLTGLPTRAAFVQVMLDAARSGRAMTLLQVGVDRFRDVNEHFGPDVGDAVLVEIAARLRDAAGPRRARGPARRRRVRAAGRAARSTSPRVEELAGRLLAAAAKPCPARDREGAVVDVTVGASIGLASADRSSTPATTAGRRAAHGRGRGDAAGQVPRAAAGTCGGRRRRRPARSRPGPPPREPPAVRARAGRDHAAPTSRSSSCRRGGSWASRRSPAGTTPSSASSRPTASSRWPSAAG